MHSTYAQASLNWSIYMKSSRQKEIIRLLEQEKVVSTMNLAEQFEVSVETIRRDLDQLEKQGFLNKIYGGAELRSNGAEPWPSLAIRTDSFQEDKSSIALAAMQYVPDHCTIALDAGSTVGEFCRHLSSRKNMTIICSDIHNAALVLASGGNRVYMMGGFLTTDGTSSGTYAKEFCSSLGELDLFVCSTDGASPEDGLTTNEMGINELKRRYMKKAKTTILLADHSKFKQKGFYKMCDFSEVDILITDSMTPADTVEAIRNSGCQVVITTHSL